MMWTIQETKVITPIHLKKCMGEFLQETTVTTIITVAPQATGSRVTHCTRFGQVHTEIYYSKTVDTLALIGTTHPFHMLGSSPDLDTVLTSLGQD